MGSMTTNGLLYIVLYTGAKPKGVTKIKFPICFPGTSLAYSHYQVHVTGGNYDNTTGTLTVTDSAYPNGYNLEGQANVLDKSVRGTIQTSGFPFWLNYQGAK